MRVRARAKLTLSLRVTGVRVDGYHELDAEMVTVSLADELTFGPGRNVLPPEDLVSRALAAVGRQAHVVVDKRIPAGAGLGGGSADAAAVLRWAGCDDLGVAAALRVEPSLAEWRDRLEAATGQRPRLAGSGGTWFVEGACPEAGLVVHTERP